MIFFITYSLLYFVSSGSSRMGEPGNRDTQKPHDNYYVHWYTLSTGRITVQIDGSDGNGTQQVPIVGSMYSLSCTVTEADSLIGSRMITYLWFKNGVEVSGQTMNFFSFTPGLNFSDAGSYTCQATIPMMMSINSTNSFNITLDCKSVNNVIM